MSLDQSKFISADGHVMEPPDLWTTRMDKRFRHRAPHVESREDADYLCIDGVEPRAVTDLISNTIESFGNRQLHPVRSFCPDL